MIAHSGRTGGGAAAALGLVVALTFAFTVVGSNIPGPLLPLYEERLGMSPFVLAALFATYFAALISMFLVMNRTRVGRHVHLVLPGAVLVGILGDVALWLGSDFSPLLFLGRALTGVCVGAATGSAATLAVTARGEAGRTLAATGAIGGSLIGLLSAAVVAETFADPTVLIYRLHAVALLVCEVLLIVVLWWNRARIRAATVVEPTVSSSSGRGQPRDMATPGRLAAYGLGAAGWTVGGIAVGVLPTTLRSSLQSGLLVAGVLGGIVLLVAAWIAPHVARVVRRTLSAPRSLVLLGSGGVVLVAGVLSGRLVLVLVGCLLWGIGQGFAYAKGLELLTRGSTPVQQGRATSLYACVSYGFAASMILLAGALSSGLGYVRGTAVMVLLFSAFCGAVLAFGRRYWKSTSVAALPDVLAVER
ncbi:Major Facilitator Superfamily protein [Rhodococcus rhodochrous J3]|uniref:Major Facilitator Superfamily protein n=1 Tax=Rhodococcus rhodochrous J3 TaxID=903528 RepID=A0ABY1MGJ3_RHORH|nr:MFS transporter [Rhodococcus rhodochrous]MBF4480263.1 MFS transporter [Rhodococcus rhodochrous]SMG52850.1 Major Facilitator Superfamily protein [Rhodococcus rhodochrous J3]